MPEPAKPTLVTVGREDSHTCASGSRIAIHPEISLKRRSGKK